jgi:IS30 family transposase
MPNNKHLTLDDRNFIHTGLNNGLSFRQIALHLDKDPSTISKEIRKNRVPIFTGSGGNDNRNPNRNDLFFSDNGSKRLQRR